MTDKQEFEGIGYHYSDSDGDYLLVSQWSKRPNDLKGQSLTIGKLLPQELRCMNLQDHYNAGYSKNSLLQKFRFRITVEIEKSN